MKKNHNSLFLIIIFAFLSFSTKAQVDFSANHNFMAEIGLFEGGSLRYENSIFVKDNFTILGSLGISTIHTTLKKGKDYPNTLIIPFGINMVFGQSKNHFETGIGYRWGKHYYEYPRSIEFDEFQLNIGYRYQKLKENGFLFKLGLTTVVEGRNDSRHVFPSNILDRLLLSGFIGVGYGF